MTRNPLRELAQYAYLILSFTRRDIRARYKQTALGATWAVLQPLSLMVIFTLVFDKVARIPTDGTPYPIFSYSALIFWSFFSTTVSQGTLSMTANSNLVRKIYFPRETLLLAVLLSAGLDLAIAFTMLWALMFFYGVVPTVTLLWILNSDRVPADVPASGRAAVAVNWALAQVGKAYVYGAAGPSAFDCSGLTMRAWGAAGVALPHSSSAQYAMGPHVARSDLQPGDLVFFYSPISHVGMYIGNGMIVHASNPSTGVLVAPLAQMPYVGATRPG